MQDQAFVCLRSPDHNHNGSQTPRWSTMKLDFRLVGSRLFELLNPGADLIASVPSSHCIPTHRHLCYHLRLTCSSLLQTCPEILGLRRAHPSLFPNTKDGVSEYGGAGRRRTIRVCCELLTLNHPTSRHLLYTGDYSNLLTLPRSPSSPRTVSESPVCRLFQRCWHPTQRLPIGPFIRIPYLAIYSRNYRTARP
ncbi:hypothetical protein BDP81DRAFT_437715 [Colletotrichum phormii]|uniref:Uncharacterized protein n=1 Tax=Colletotrichum phormii TaxID=359342 RepID=A0AAJ0EB00_9PEZI|nr:uncharacterized protein BDP81DRAFT_437715 [Colletotrichum phormii]KAK1624510.1 hypothetical protein BDP81DRAFT_437715 [Colletotrichum phormii]